MALTNFRAIDFKKDGSAVKVARSKRDRVQKPTSSAPATDPNEVPAGTIPEVLDWVGSDVERAKRALDVESKDEKPRKGLVEELNGIVEDGESQEDSGTEDPDTGEAAQESAESEESSESDSESSEVE